MRLLCSRPQTIQYLWSERDVDENLTGATKYGTNLEGASCNGAGSVQARVEMAGKLREYSRIICVLYALNTYAQLWSVVQSTAKCDMITNLCFILCK